MDDRYRTIASLAAGQHGIISAVQLDAAGVSSSLRSQWTQRGLLQRTGPHSYSMAGADPTWERSLAIAQVDIGKRGVIAGRSAALLHGLDGFNRGPVEVIVPRGHRRVVAAARVCSTRRELHRGDTVVVDGIRCLTAERTILEAPLFGFTRAEIENAVDSGIRLRRISEQRLRTRVVAMHHQSINGARALLDALVDSGGESRLERWMLRLIREAGLPRPVLQKTFHEGTRVVARVDMIFGNVVVEVAGHGTHSSRRQRQADEQRRTELLVRGYVVVTFTYDDVRDRPKWVVEQLRRVLAGSFCAA